MNYKDLEEVNKKLKTTDIKGKNYIEVNERIKAFRMLFPDGLIDTQLVSNENGICIFKAQVGYYEDEADGCIRWLGTGYAYEKENSTFINKTSYIENCETSAVGRALGMAGFGIETSVASAEEVQNAIVQQEEDKKITKIQEVALRDKINNLGIEDECVISVLNEKGYKKLAEIKMKDYIYIVKEIDKLGSIIGG